MGPEAPRVLAVANAVEIGVCLSLGHLPGLHGGAHAGAGVSGPDGHCGCIELGVGRCAPQSPCLLGCDLTGFDHVIETLQQALAVHIHLAFFVLERYPTGVCMVP